ncbi:MFS transporter [Salisediminibacterium halotolerans]|uniref:MFS transporter n=1 Tax=Salisediminibacterium halotolerans TaxID=517425 RepID=UPI000EB07B57|nr:MFS transporter [Salisediminibacterium halotolerans]RLJ75413.1 putative MFS family arabinose efflux permease [Actinophytocola xinjiangensis]RPE89267.1 putative MFS family arabinose efflux permease [Salisediminibacterium halotolerans]TWG36026.1 putative MFS family arabinose efflux permease [Salisediminibacterium halotolerans]GEL07821.1 MFS transporter [Salisediminibacterium halotolerans]
MGKIIGEWRDQFRRYNRNVKLFLLSSVLVHIGMGIFMIIYNYYIRELGYDDQTNGSVIAMQSTATALFLLPAGIMSDRTGRKRILLIGALLGGASLLLRASISPELLLLAGAFMTGMFMAFIQVSSIPLLAENSTQQQRVHLFSLNFAIMMGAQVIGNLAGGSLSDGFHLLAGFSQLWSIRLTLLLGGVIFLSSLIPILKIKEAQKITKQTVEDRSFKKLFRTNKEGLKIILLFAVAQMIIGFGSGLVIPYLNLYFVDRFETTHTMVGIILSSGQAMTAVAMMIGPAVVRKAGEVRAVVILQLASIPFLLITAFTEMLWLAVFGFLFRQALMNAGNPIQMSLMMRSVDDSIKGLAHSVGQAVFQLGWAVMGPVSTTIVLVYGAYEGYAIVFSITGGLYLLGTFYFYLVFRKRIPDAEEI